MNNLQNFVFVPQSGVAQDIVNSMSMSSNIKLFGLGFVLSIPPSYKGEEFSLSSTQICGGEWWKKEEESVSEFAQRIMGTDMGTDPYNPQTEYGCEYWVIGFSDPTNPNEEPTLVHKVWEGKW